MTVIWAKTRDELSAVGLDDYRVAEVQPHWRPGYFVFRAYSNSNSRLCIEAVGTDSAALIAVAERWYAGEWPAEVYCTTVP